MGYSFNYEGLTLLYMYNQNDEEFLNIALPGIIELEDGKMSQTFALLEKINSTLKYVKAQHALNILGMVRSTFYYGQYVLILAVSIASLFDLLTGFH